MTQLQLDSPYFASIDLGSNSFHMLIVRVSDAKMEIIDREKDMVQIARGIGNDGHLDEKTQARALACLHRFSERLQDIPEHHIRAVGTKTLRSAQNSNEFIRAAEAALNAPIQIISGYEEARLVYTGVFHSIDKGDHPQKRLIIDIGGASTEFVIGKSDEPKLLESLSMGCVSFTRAYLTTGITEKTMQRAYMAACSQLEEISQPYKKAGWDIAFGTSGTMKAIAELVSDKGAGAVISQNALNTLYQHIINDNRLADADIPKLRREVLPAGIAILKAIFDQLRIDQLHVADATLKEGLIYDTIGRFSNHDSRESTIEKLQVRYEIDREQATRVSDMALNFWSAIESPFIVGISRSKILRWAARLHEIGMSISHSSHHQHAFYLLRHSDLAGFSRYEQFLLANLVRSHRKKIVPAQLEGFHKTALAAFKPMILCLRLAVRLNRLRASTTANAQLSGDGNLYTLTVDKNFLQQNPLTHAGLQQEIEQLKRIDIHLQLKH